MTAALAPKGKALRDGKWETIDAQHLVPGDVVLLKFGDIIPADVKLLGEEGHDDQVVQIDQAALTGESLPVKKRAGDVAFSGSAVKQGEIPAVVYATGKNTFFGRAATLLEGTDNVANLQKVYLGGGVKVFVVFFLGVCVVVVPASDGVHDVLFSCACTTLHHTHADPPPVPTPLTPAPPRS